MGAKPRVVARDLLVKRFRWSAGHADFSAALRDADLLAAIGPALGETGRQAVLLGAFAVDVADTGSR